MGMRRSSLEPKELQSRKAKGLSAWCLNVPAELSDTGKRQQLFFPTKKAAAVKCEELEARRDNFGTSLTLLSSSKITEAAKAYEMLEPYGIGLLEAVKGHLEAHKRRTASVSFLDLCNQYLAAKSGRDERHLKGLRNTRDRFPTLHALLVSEIMHRDLEPLVNAIVPGGRNLILRHLRSFFNYAIKKGFAVNNPVDRMDFVETVRKEVEVIAAADVAKMLESALHGDLKLLPFLTLGFFTGIRPEELRLLQWSDIDLPGKSITIRAEVSKTRKRRFPELSENALQWIEAYRRAGGSMKGPLTDLQEDALFEHRRKNRIAAGVEHWPNSAMRHSFCSCWLAAHKDVNKLVLLSGHDSPDTMWRHYNKGVSEAEAAKYWAIAPKNEATNAVSFSSEA
jgi:integrase